MSDVRVDSKGDAPGTFGSLRVRNFRLFFSGQLISQVGNWLTLISQTLLVLKITKSGFDIGLLAACQFGPVLLIGAWAGLVADRSDKRKLLIIVQILAMLQSFALAAIAFSPHPSLFGLYAVAVFGGVCTAFDNPARRAFVVEMVPDHYVQNAVSLNSAMMTGARVVGPLLAGLLISTVGYGWCFTTDALSYIAVIIGLAMMRQRDMREQVMSPRGRGQVRAGLRYVRTVPDLMVPLIMMAVIGTFAYNLNVVMPLLVENTLHGSTGTFTFVYAALSLGSLFGALYTARRTTVSRRDINIAASLFGGSMVLLAFTPNLGFAFPIGIIVGLASVTFMTTSTSIMQIRADPAMRGRVLALQAIVFLGSTPIGGPIVGWVCEHFSPRVGLLVGAVSCFVAVAYGVWGAGPTPRPEPVRASGADAIVDMPAMIDVPSPAGGE